MKAETVQQAINFVLGTPRVQQYISELEAPPDNFVIFQISASVINYHDSIIRVLINFNERGNPNNFKEDAVIDVRGTNFSDFQILKLGSTQIDP
jgi:hypothetical protein